MNADDASASMEVVLRPAICSRRRGMCGRICYDGFKALNERHGFPTNYPSVEAATARVRAMLEHPAVFGVVAERRRPRPGLQLPERARPDPRRRPDRGRSGGPRARRRPAAHDGGAGPRRRRARGAAGAGGVQPRLARPLRRARLRGQGAAGRPGRTALGTPLAQAGRSGRSGRRISPPARRCTSGCTAIPARTSCARRSPGVLRGWRCATGAWWRTPRWRRSGSPTTAWARPRRTWRPSSPAPGASPRSRLRCCCRSGRRACSAGAWRPACGRSSRWC